MSNARSNATLGTAAGFNGAFWTEGNKTFVTAKSHAALTVGTPVIVAYTKDGVATAAAATRAFPSLTGVVMEAASGAGTWVKVQVGGECEALVDGTTDVAAGDSLEVINAGTAFIKDGTARAATTAAFAVDAQAANSAVLVTVYLIPEGHTIAAS